MSDDDVFYRISTIMNIDPAEIAKIVHDYIERDIGCGTLYDRFNSPPPPIYIGPVKVETLKERLDNYKKHKHIKEDNKMNATSVQVINNVKDMSVTIERGPFDGTRIIISVSTDDDTYEINCSGDGCEKFLKKHEFIPIQEYKYFNNQLIDREKEIRQLKEENERIKENLNSQHEMIKEINQKNLKLQEENNGCSAMIHGKVYNPAQMVDRILELEALKTPSIENFADEEPSSRSDILDLAKKCVCGKREQDYGTPESNFQLIADLWNQYLFKDPNVKEVFGIGPMDVSMMMALMKIARIRNGGGSGDSFVDLAGYAACGGEIWALKKETNGDLN